MAYILKECVVVKDSFGYILYHPEGTELYRRARKCLDRLNELRNSGIRVPPHVYKEVQDDC